MGKWISRVTYDFYQRRIGELCEQFPSVFNKQFPLPLKVGIHLDLAKNTEFTKKEISALLRVWVRRHEYACMCCSLGKRFDLDGKVVGRIEDSELQGFIHTVCNHTKHRSLYRFCKRFNNLFGRPALIFVPVKVRPELEKFDAQKEQYDSSKCDSEAI